MTVNMRRLDHAIRTLVTWNADFHFEALLLVAERVDIDIEFDLTEVDPENWTSL
jgi:hypothetical protein